MNIAQEIFGKKRPIYNKLIEYGFEPEDKSLPPSQSKLIYRESFMDEALIAVVTVDPAPATDNCVSCQAIDAETDEEYVLINIGSSTGSYVGEARDEYRNLLERIANACFYEVPFVSEQSNRIAAFIAREFSVDPDFPFSTAPDAAAFRHQKSRKIFGLLMSIRKTSLLKKSNPHSEYAEDGEYVEAINIKINPDTLEDLLQEPGIYPCYHMNKKLWATVALDESLEDERIMELIRDSFEYTLRPEDAVDSPDREKNYWIIPSNPAYFDVAAGFRTSGSDTLTWHQRIHVQPGDIVYIYQTEPVASLMWKCEVTESSLAPPAGLYSAEHAPKHVTQIMYLKRLTSYQKGRYSRAWLNAHGIKKTVRGQRRAPMEMVEALESSEHK